MINNWVEKYTPKSSILTNLLVAGLMWSFVGIFLLSRGVLNLMVIDRSYLFLIIIWALIGLLKGRFVLDKTAVRIIDRILVRGGGKCAGGFFSPKSWGLVAAMILFGRLLRSSPLPAGLVWGVYVAIGAGLLFSSRIFWIKRFKGRVRLGG